MLSILVARYLTDPDLIVWNDTTNDIVDTTSLIGHAPNGSISEIEQLVPLFGLDSEPHRIISVNNSNGVGIVSMTTSQLWYCNLYTDNSNSWIYNNIIWCR